MTAPFPPALVVDALAVWIAAYRAAGRPADQMLRTAQETFPEATGSDYAVALLRANRARGGGHG